MRALSEAMSRRGLQTSQRIAWLLDDLFRVPGTNIRFGLDPLLGLLPGGGDVAGGLASAYTIVAASRAGAPPSVVLRMAGNIVLDVLLGIVPLLGDVIDVGWKANRRNVALLERFLETPAPVQRSSRLFVGVVLIGLLVLLIGAAALSVIAIRWILGAMSA